MNEQEPNTRRTEEEVALDSPSSETTAVAEPVAPDCQDCPWRKNNQQTTDGYDQPILDEPDCSRQGNSDHTNQDDPERPAECQRTCKRNFWTEILRTVFKVTTVVLAAFGVSSFASED